MQKKICDIENNPKIYASFNYLANDFVAFTSALPLSSFPNYVDVYGGRVAGLWIRGLNFKTFKDTASIPQKGGGVEEEPENEFYSSVKI